MTGLFYANATRAFSVYYLYENENDEKPQGWGGNDRGGWSEVMLQAIDLLPQVAGVERPDDVPEPL